ncbi:MAG: hypothetical protein EOM65_14635 [Synergistales bacterium]|nr:hypothetical protein [Synergistales bacterium]
MDYRVRGFTRDLDGNKHFIDHSNDSIQDFIDPEILGRYQTMDVNLSHSNLFHTKMILREFDLDNYLFDTTEQMLLPGERKKIRNRIKKEMQEIFSGMNISQI